MALIPGLTPITSPTTGTGLIPLGAKPVNPASNITPPSNTLPANQTAPTGYQAGQLTSLLKTQGKTADDSTLNSLWSQYGNGGTYANDTAHNSVIYGKMNSGSTGSTPPTNPNGLSNAQVSQGYSTQTGAFNPVTGQAWNTSTNPNPNIPPVIPPVPTGGTTGTQQYTANNGLYGQLITGLANTQPNAGQQTAITGLNQLGSTPSPAVQQAQNDLVNWKDQYGKQTANIAGTPGDLSLANGEQGVLQNKYLTGLDARNVAVQNALSQQGQQINAYSAAGTQGGNQQGLLQQALNQAATLSAPTTGIAYGTQTYNPVTGQYDTSGGSPFLAGQVQGENALGSQYAQNNSAYNQATAVKNQVVGFLNNTPINPSDFTDVNSIIGLLSGKVSDPKYQQLSSQLNEYLQTITPIMGVGGNATDLKTSLAQGMLNGHMTAQAIVDQLNTLEQTAKTKLDQQAFGGGTKLGTNSGTYTGGASGQSIPNGNGGTMFGSFFGK